MRLHYLQMLRGEEQTVEEGKGVVEVEAEVDSQDHPRASGRWSVEEWKCWSVANQ